MNLAAYAPAGLVLGPAVLAVVEEAYATEGREYHSLAHVEAVARLFAELDGEGHWQDPASVFVAVLFHDAVYVPGATDNEARSAELARATLAADPVGAGLALDRIAHLVTLTAQHGKLTPDAVDSDEALFLDIDMAVLGASEKVFDAYDRGVAAEYSFLPLEVYAAGRRAFLERLLASPRIYLSDLGHARWDTKARANLGRALDGA